MGNIKEAFSGLSKPSIAVDTVIFRVVDSEITTNRAVPRKDMQVLLIRERGSEEWHFPGTIMRLGETSHDAIKRIVDTKINIEDIYFEQLYTVDSNPLRDNRGHIVSIVYIGIAKDNQEIELAENSRYEAQWFWLGTETNDDGTLKKLLGEKDKSIVQSLKYDHTEMLGDALSRLKGKLMYTDIAFKFMHEKFTIRELENTFCAVKMNTIPGFRRIIADKIRGTGIMSDGKAFRPAELYEKI